MTDETPKKKPRGLEAMDPERRREIQSRGGKAAQAKGTGHRWDKAGASEAGKKGRKARPT